MTASNRTMTTQGELPDIVERLRRPVYYSHAEIINLMDEAADLIERLRATPPGSPLEREGVMLAAIQREEDYLHRLIEDEDIGSVMHGDIEGAFSRLRTDALPSPSPTEREGE